MSTTLHVGDLPDGVGFGATVAVDTETLGLNPHRDRLCLVQLAAGDGACHLVQFRAGASGAVDYSAANLKRLLGDPGVLKLFHYARFDIAVLHRYLGVAVAPLYCTKIASRLTRTYSDRHGLEDLCRELLGIDLSKRQQSSDWARASLSS
ncbi:MAG: ribonuclease H-like domain-containing protein, partial [Gemmatimonadetes bacterium]|nr:ribonuclease H-like domain-containing protein [Gemmatimonadota bacterium]